jgi:hypothetical protein
MILDTFAADPFATAGIISAGAVFQIFLDATISFCHVTSLIFQFGRGFNPRPIKKTPLKWLGTTSDFIL